MEPVALIVPVKRFDQAKSRLGQVPDRAALALALALDTAAAALQVESVTVVVVTDEPEAGRLLREMGAMVVPDGPDNGLNPAISHGAESIADGWVGALSSDLPALRPLELTATLRQAQRCGVRCYVPDRAGAGTTLLLAPPGAELQPSFGSGSAHRHASSGATPVGLEQMSVRTDVDTWSDMEAAEALGIGRHTRLLLNQWRER